MKAKNKYNANQKLLLFLLVGLFIQFYSVPFIGTHLKIYMICTIIVFLFMGLKIPIKGYCNYEILWLISYLILGVSILWAPDRLLGLQLLFGEVILVFFFLVLKNLLNPIPEFQASEIFLVVFRMYLYVSVLLYVIGLLSVYVFHNDSLYAISLNDTSSRLFGCYRETVLIRFTGLAESPNNYAYFANFIFWFFVWKNKRKEAVLTLITLVLTLSTTVYLVFPIQVILYYYWGGRLTFKTIFLSLSLYLIYVFLTRIPDIQIMLENRMVRNETGSGRFALWRFALGKISEGPLFGYGLNQSRTLFTERHYASSHNNILEMGLSLGYLGSLLYIIFLIIFLKQTYSWSKKYKIPFIGQTATAYFIFGFANNILHIEYTVFVMAIVSYYINNLRSPIRGNTHLSPRTSERLE